MLANLLPPGLVVAGLGCGRGYFGRALLGLCARLVCVDASEGMLAVARERLSPAPPQTAVEFRVGGLDGLPIDDGELDAVVCGMVLHHLPELESAAREMHRVLRPGGTAVVLELEPHKEAWMRTTLGDRHLGLEPGDVVRAFERAGFSDLRVEDVDDRYAPKPQEGKAPALGLFIVRGRRAA